MRRLRRLLLHRAGLPPDRADRAVPARLLPVRARLPRASSSGSPTDGTWTLLVRSRCRHLDGNRCGAFGQPERPLVCSFYDAHKCGYKNQLGELRPHDFVRVRDAEFDALAGCFAFDDHGMTVAAPGPEDVRAAVEAGWRGAAILEG